MKKTFLYSLTSLLLLLTTLQFIETCLTLKNPLDSQVHTEPIIPVIPWHLILVNPSNPLPEDFSVKFTELRNGHAVDERIYPDLQAMMDAARAEGLNPLICSSYRSLEKQEALFENKVSEYLSHAYSQEEAEIEAAKWVAKPGTSEHHTGLAVDIVSMDYQLLDEAQETTPEQQWLTS